MYDTEERQQDRLQYQLEMQSHQIERVLSNHQVNAQVVGGSIKPHAVSFDLHGQLAMGMEKISRLKDDLIRSLGTTAVNLIPTSSKNSDTHVQVEVDTVESPPVPLLDLIPIAEPLPPLSGAIGLDENGRAVTLDFSAPKTSNVLLTGESGAGKTTLLRALAASLAIHTRQSKLQLIIIAPQSQDDIPYAELDPLQHLPSMLTRPYYGIEEAADALDFLSDEMAYRRDQRMNTPALVILLDEVSPLLDKRAATLQRQLIELLQHGSEVGIHLVMGTREPETAVNNNAIRANIHRRIVGRSQNAQQSRLATGLIKAQAEYLLGQGDFLDVHHGKAHYFQAASISDYDLHMTLRKLYRDRPRPLLAQSFSPRPAIEAEEKPSKSAPQHFIFDGHSISQRYDIPPQEEGEELYDPFPFDISFDDMPPPPEAFVYT